MENLRIQRVKNIGVAPVEKGDEIRSSICKIFAFFQRGDKLVLAFVGELGGWGLKGI